MSLVKAILKSKAVTQNKSFKGFKITKKTKTDLKNISRNYNISTSNLVRIILISGVNDLNRDFKIKFK